MSLVGEERKREILDIINDAGKVQTNDLVKRFRVSSETIRRYLEELEAENRLKRVYGGAVKMTLVYEELSHTKREVLRVDEKKRIGRAAAALVQDHDVIVIDDGSTTLQMIPYLLYKKNLTIITNSISGLNMIMDYQNKEMFSGEVFFIGGKIDPRHYRISGSLAEKFMESFFVNKAFISIDGIMPEQGITSFDSDRALLAQKMMHKSEQTIILTDSSKFGVNRLYKIADFAAIDVIVCEEECPSEWSLSLEQQQVNWITAD
ncbi:DeoR/GlpR family DNA-binding transcription regulator [Paenibacillus glycanilyticus]|uniref:DeoR/GlpR family DNA-binding transcription regulator n=1 Tax=Paenibacillus glycanilyticus TaxID=126569 RepID=UPI00203AFCDC|nr:DeoR/GlpR family DNA-binding transcription regulator [Paenibacillus glycanilyticus]MCM3630158.1 DeoR/GlpR family DNA-binding transcription regulator [Paenibacillus glycanilyticus]